MCNQYLQNLGGAIGVTVASSIAASHLHTLNHHGYPTAAALTGGFQLALWVRGLTGLVAVPERGGGMRHGGKCPPGSSGVSGFGWRLRGLTGAGPAGRTAHPRAGPPTRARFAPQRPIARGPRVLAARPGTG
jgi:hypothetical protein